MRSSPSKPKAPKLLQYLEDRMNIRRNARLTPIGRERLLAAMLSGRKPEAAARAAGVCPRTMRKWSGRCEAQEAAGLIDRSSQLRDPCPKGGEIG